MQEKSPKGILFIVGGSERRCPEQIVLRSLVECVNGRRGNFVIATTATRASAEELYQEYRKTLSRLGVKHMSHLSVSSREDARSPANVRMLKNAACVFFTGGDQLRITSIIGGTPLGEMIHRLHEKGGVIAGTSAGAAAMSETMLVAGQSDGSHRIGGTLRMAPGFGLISSIIIDQHFAERGRIGRLMGAVAQNPKQLGIGIDENTAIIVDHNRSFRVVGKGAVYVLDAHDVSASNISDGLEDEVLTIYDLKLHVLSHEDCFNIETRRPHLDMRGWKSAA